MRGAAQDHARRRADEDGRLLGPDPQRLLAWYDANARDLPWRRDRDPYRVLVSEIMLQQTRAEVVERRFPEFLQRFPDLDSLAAASEDEVLAAWSGLGYYRRARSLHACARALAERRGWLRTAKELKSLPGVGDYTAAAVASIAFDESIVVVDGNVKRVAARLTAERGDSTRRAVLDRLREAAAQWLDPERPGDSNQALMELGATVCTPQPRCARCPLAGACRARAEGNPGAYPKAKRATPSRKCRWRLAVIRDGQRVLLAQRSLDEAWLPGIYELPWAEADAEPAAATMTIAERYGLDVRFAQLRGEVRHAIGRRDIYAEVWSAKLVAPATAGELAENAAAGVWADRGERARLATSSLVAKALSVAGEDDG